MSRQLTIIVRGACRDGTRSPMPQGITSLTMPCHPDCGDHDPPWVTYVPSKPRFLDRFLTTRNWQWVPR